jgi:hypothetical protein
MDFSIQDQDGNELEITLGSDIYLMDGSSGSDSNFAWSELSEATQEKLYELSDQYADALEAVKAEVAKRLDDLLEDADSDADDSLDEDESFDVDE